MKKSTNKISSRSRSRFRGNFIIFLIAFLVLSLVSYEGYGGGKKWTGNIDSDWDNVGNWDGDPTAQDATIDPANYTGAAASVNITSAITRIPKKVTVSGGAQMTIGNNFSNGNGGAKEFIIKDATTQVTITGGIVDISTFLTVNTSANLIVTGGTIDVATYFELASSATATMSGGSMTIDTDNGPNPFTVNSGTVFNFSGGTININNTSPLNNLGTINASGTSSLEFNGTNTWDNQGAFAGTGGTVVINGSTTLTDGGPTGTYTFYDLTINSGQFLSQGTGSGLAPTNINIKHNYTNSGGTFDFNENSVTFNGSTVQTLTLVASDLFYDVVVDNSASYLDPNADFKVSNSLTMTQGNIDMGSSKLVLGTGTGNVGTLSFTAGNIIGQFERWITATGTPIDFPVGTSANNNLFNIDFTNLTPPGGSLIVEFINSDPGSTGLPLAENSLFMNSQYTEGYWDVAAANSLASTDYDLALTGNGFTSYTMDAETRIIKRLNGGSSWTLDGSHAAGAAPVANRDALSGISTAHFGLSNGDACSAIPTSAITGNSSVCENVTGEPYSVTNNAGYTYAWTITGGSQASGTNTNSITVDWGAGGAGDVSVIATSPACGNAAAVNLPVIISPAPFPITGDNTVCEGDTGEAYSVTNTAGYTYDWTISGGTQVSGTNTNSITVDWISGDGNVSVVATSPSCGDATAVNLQVTISPAVATSVVTGDDFVFENVTGEAYSVTNTAGYTYAWTITGGTQASGSNTNSITVDWGTAGAGDVSVVATSSGCGAQAAVNLPVTIAVAPPTGPGGVGTTNGASNLSLWLDANTITGISDGADMSGTWDDQSGNGNDATIENGAPSYSAAGGGNGQPAVTFDKGNNESMEVSGNSEILPTNEISVFLVGNYEDASDSWAAFLFAADDNDWDDGWGIAEENATGEMDMWVDNYLNPGCEQNISADYGTDNVWSMVFNTTDDLFSAYKSENTPCTDTFTGPINYDTGGNDNLLIGVSRAGTPNLTGDIEEILVYDVAVNDAQRIIISNYLAAKYAISLTNNDVYSRDGSGFDFDVAGIGQAADASNHTDAQGSGWVRMNTASDLENSEYLMWGHDDASLTLNTADVPGGTNNRTNRKWSLSENGGDGVGTVTLTFDCSNFIIGEPNDLQLLIDADGTFAAGATTHTTGLSYNSSTGVVTFTGVDFADTDHFALGSASAENVLGGIHYSIADGVFTSTSIWSLQDSEGSSCTCAPTSGSDHVIIVDDAVTLAADESVDNLRIENGGSLTYTAASVDLTIIDGGSLTLDDGSLIDGNTQTNPSIIFDGSTAMDVSVGGTGDRITDLDIITSNSATTTFSGTGDITVNNFDLNETNNVTVNNLTGTLTTTDLRFEVNDNMTFTNNGPISITGDLAFNTTNSTLTNNSTITITDDVLSDNATDDGNVLNNNSVMTVGDDFDMADADFTVNNAGTFTHSGDFLNVGGAEVFNNLNGSTWTSSATSHAGVTFNSNDAVNTFIYDLSGAQDVFVPSDGQYYNVTFQGSGVKTPLASIVVLNDLIIRETATLEMSTNTADINVGGDWTNNSTFNTGTQTVIFDGTGAQAINHLIAPGAFYNLTVQSSGTQTPNGNIDVNNDLTIGGTATLEMSTNTANLFLGGNWNNTGGTFNEGSQTVAFDNTGAGQAISTSAASETFYDIDISNSGQTVTLNDAVNISNTLEFTTSGYIDINANDLTITNWDDGDIVGLGTNLDRFVIVDQTGFLKATGVGAAETVNFPIGVSTGAANYARADILNSDGANTSFDINLCNYINQEGTCSGGNQLTTDVVDYTWNIVSSSTNATVSLYWDTSMELAGFDRTDMVLSHHGHVGSWWTPLGTTGSASNLTGTVYSFSRATTSFSPFGAGESGSPLPIELVRFDAKSVDNNSVQLEWQTALEINNEQFIIERSDDAFVFYEIGAMDGRGNSQIRNDYEFIDYFPLSGINYYRLKQIDFDGTFTYSDIVSVSMKNNDELLILSVFPNPTNGKILNLTTSGLNQEERVLMQIISVYGSPMLSRYFYADDRGEINIQIPDIKNWSDGFYIITLYTEKSLVQGRIIKK